MADIVDHDPRTTCPLRQTERVQTTLAEAFIEAGWDRFIRDRRAPERWATYFGEIGICSSIEHRPGEREYRLHLSKAGRDLRQAVVEIASQ